VEVDLGRLKVVWVVPAVELEVTEQQRDRRSQLLLILLLWVVVGLLERIRIIQIMGQTLYLVRLLQQVEDEVQSRVQILSLMEVMADLAVAVRTTVVEIMVIQALAYLGKVTGEGTVQVIHEGVGQEERMVLAVAVVQEQLEVMDIAMILAGMVGMGQPLRLQDRQ
jgi:hypothetical protein